MKPEYTAWIESYTAAQPERYVRGKCREATVAMIETYPELRQAAGFVYCTWGREEHFWCMTADGEVIDPTKSQYHHVFRYEEIDLSDPEQVKKIPTGRCMDCGDDTYEDKTFCDERCEAATRAYMGI